jgi:hypothetical protein
MNNSTTIISKLIAYEELYTSFEPSKKNSLDLRVHRLVGLLISAHFNQVRELGDLIRLIKEFENFIRELKAEFDLMYHDLDDHSYPTYVRKLSGIKCADVFSNYHELIIETLKLLLFRIKSDGNPAELEKELDRFVKASIEHYSPKSKPTLKFGVSAKPASDKDSDTPLNKLNEYVQRQIDIALDI